MGGVSGVFSKKGKKAQKISHAKIQNNTKKNKNWGGTEEDNLVVL